MPVDTKPASQPIITIFLILLAPSSGWVVTHRHSTCREKPPSLTSTGKVSRGWNSLWGAGIFRIRHNTGTFRGDETIQTSTQLRRSGALISPFHGEASRSALNITGIKPSTPVHHCQKFSVELRFGLTWGSLLPSPCTPLPHSSSSSSPADRSCLHRSLNARAPPHASLFGVPVACDSGKIALLRRVLCCSDGNLPPLTSVVLLIRQKEQMHSPTTRTMNLTVLFLLSLSCTVFLTDTSGKTIPNFSS